MRYVRAAMLQAACAAAVAGMGSEAMAADGTWITNTASFWNTPAAWQGGIIADGAGSTAFFNSTLVTVPNIAVHLDANRTLGTLNFGYSTSTTQWNMVTSNNSFLTLSSGGLDVSGNAKVVFNYRLDATTLNKSGSGTLSLAGGVSMSAINVLGGTLEIAPGMTSAPINTDGVLRFTGGGANFGNISGTGRIEMPMSTSLFIGGTTSHTGGTQINYNTTLSGGSGALRGAFEMRPGSVLNADGIGGGYLLNGPITGEGTVKISQPASLGNAGNTYGGQTQINMTGSGQELWLLSNSAFGFSSVTLGQGTIRASTPTTINNALTFGNNVSINGPLTFTHTNAKTVDGSLTFSDGTSSMNGPIAASAGSSLTIDTPAVVTFGSSLSSDGAVYVFGDLTVQGSQFTKLGGNSLIWGTLRTPNGTTVPSGGLLRMGGSTGKVLGRFSGAAGSKVLVESADGQIGDVNSFAGFYTDGEVSVIGGSLTLKDRNQAAMGSLTTLGNSFTYGILNADNGIVVDFGRTIAGNGWIQSTNSLDKAVIINGAAEGDSTTSPLRFTGYVKGAGTFRNVTFMGTFSPGLSPTSSLVDSISLGAGSTLVMELGGVNAGTQYDQLNIMTSAGLGGTLQVDLINGFVPTLGDEFSLFVGNTTGAFGSIVLPALDPGLTWDTTELYTTGLLTVVPEPSAAAALAMPFMLLSRRMRRSAVTA